MGEVQDVEVQDVVGWVTPKLEDNYNHSWGLVIFTGPKNFAQVALPVIDLLKTKGKAEGEVTLETRMA